MTTALVTFALIAVAVGVIVIRKRKRPDTATGTEGGTTVAPDKNPGVAVDRER